MTRTFSHAWESPEDRQRNGEDPKFANKAVPKLGPDETFIKWISDSSYVYGKNGQRFTRDLSSATSFKSKHVNMGGEA